MPVLKQTLGKVQIGIRKESFFSLLDVYTGGSFIHEQQNTGNLGCGLLRSKGVHD
jgi:hypothetical protein